MLKIILIAFLSLVLSWILYRSIYLMVKRAQCNKAFLNSCETHGIAIPTLEQSISYGYPSFVVKFDTREQCEHAEEVGLKKTFEKAIGRIYRGISGFDAERAIHFTWIGRTYTVRRVETVMPSQKSKRA